MTHSEHSTERVVRVERSQHHFSLLRTANGDYLGTANGVKLATFDHVDDKAIWRRLANANGYRHEITGVRINTAPEHDESRTPLREQNANSFVHNGDLFVPEHGPDQLPSAYLDTLRNNGWVCLPAILDPLTVAALERVSCTGPWSGNVFDDCTPSLNQDPVVAKTIAEPVSLWLIRQYLRTNDIRLAHPPTIRVIDTDDGQRDVQGWHSDYPYLWGSARHLGGDRVPTVSSALALGVQRNTCITEFTQHNGATRFKLGSHTLNSGPNESWGIDADYAQPGYRAKHGLPYAGADAQVIEAPAGSIILYDARTWHRAGINYSQTKRAAMLQAMTPMFIMPFKDTSVSYKAFVDSDHLQALTSRERSDLESLLVHKIVGPLGEHAITVDER